MTINLKNFLKDKPKLSKMGEFQQLQEIDGLEISAVSADLYGSGRDDLCLFYLPRYYPLFTFFILDSFIQLIFEEEEAQGRDDEC